MRESVPPPTTTSSLPSSRDSELITTPAYAGAAFGTVEDGDLTDDSLRAAAAAELGIADRWAWMSQVHGTEILAVDAPGAAGVGDALLTLQPGLPLAVRTADCVPIVMHGEGAVSVVHAGWRGLVAGVVERTRDALEQAGTPADRAAIGPAIGPCCYEVGEEVTAAFEGRTATTTWGSPSVDLWSDAERRLTGLEVWRADLCTKCEDNFHSFRDGAGIARQTTVGWL